MPLPTIAVLKSEHSAQLTKFTNLAAPVGALVISLLILIFVVWPKFSEVLRLRTANKDLTTRASKLEQKVEKLASLDNLVLEKQLVAAEQLLPSGKGVFTLVSQIEKTAAASGVLLSRLEVAPGNLSENAAPDKPVPAQSAPKEDLGTASSIQLKLSTSSDYRSLVIFLNNLLSLPRAVAVHDLTVASSSASGSSQLRASMLLDAYWQPLPKQLASIETPVEELTAEEAARLERIESIGLSTVPTTVPSVPLGRQDIFAPF